MFLNIYVGYAVSGQIRCCGKLNITFDHVIAAGIVFVECGKMYLAFSEALARNSISIQC